MKNLSLWNDSDWGLTRDFDRLQGTINRIFDDFGRSYRSASSDFSLNAFTPACDIQETTGHFVMNFDLPGFKQEDINIQIENNQLIVSGERKFEERQEGTTVQRTERSYGRFQRVFMLPTGVESDKIEANYENGVLTLALPKAETAKPRQIKISDGKSNLLDRVFGKKPDLKISNESSKK